MKQSRLMSMLETALSTAAGFGLSLFLQWLILPVLLGVPVPLSTNLAFAAIMTVASLARGFVLRRLFEALHIRRPLSAFVQAVIAERGYPDVKDKRFFIPNFWPWHPDWWKPAGFRRDLVKAAALIIAEGEKFDRNRKRKGPV